MKALVDKLEEIASSCNVLHGSEKLYAEYPFLLDRINNDQRKIIALITPESVEQLQNIIQLETDHAFAIFTMTGRNELGGAAIPEQGDIVVFDLSKMNNIIEVNTRDAYVLLEPGVTFRQLNQYFEDNEIPFAVDYERHADQSIAASIINRQNGYTAYGDHLLMQCGMEVLLGDGRLVRTGMGAMPNSNTWQLFKYGYGPYIDGLFTQSNMGVVTKIGLWLMPKPPAYKPFMVQLPDEAALSQAVEIMRSLKINMLVPNTVVIAPVDSELMRYSDTEISTFSESSQGQWNLYAAIYGLPNNVDVIWQSIEAAFGQITGSKILTAEDLDDHSVWAQREKPMLGRFNTENKDLENYDRIELHFSSPIEGEDAVKIQQLISQESAAQGASSEIKVLSQFALVWRSMMMQVSILYPRQNKEALSHARQLAGQLVNKAAEQGYPANYVDADLQDIVDQTHHAGLKVLRARVKKAIDPQVKFG